MAAYVAVQDEAQFAALGFVIGGMGGLPPEDIRHVAAYAEPVSVLDSAQQPKVPFVRRDRPRVPLVDVDAASPRNKVMLPWVNFSAGLEILPCRERKPNVRHARRHPQYGSVLLQKRKRLPGVIEENSNVQPVFWDAFGLKHASSRRKQISFAGQDSGRVKHDGRVDLALGLQDSGLGGLVRPTGMNGGLAGVAHRKPQKNQGDYAYADLKPGRDSHLDRRFGHGLLRYKIVFFTLLGGLAAGAAGFFGLPLLIDGRDFRRLLGFGVVLVGGFGGLLLWSYGLYGSAFGYFERGSRILSGLFLGG